MIDLNDARGMTELFQTHGVEDLIELYAKFPEYREPGEDEIASADDSDVVEWSDRGPSDGRYVKTAAIKEAVRGHELAVIQALGIDWTGTRGHITCPYPDHGGEADWRWAEQKKLAFCTCIGKRPGEKKTHSIFDVVAVAIGVDFEAAKVYVAELIRRQDLIVTKTGKSERYQKTDPESLLSPRPANRDDALVWIYLGHRLGLDPAMVPRPSTPIAGHRSLGYFDPPATKNGKPVRVTSTPCAVFGQVDHDGRRHAHRIYLTPDGRGKANLGTDLNGESRDPKKSAKRTDAESTAGRSVLWGNPDTATLTVAFEGIETAAAVAVAFPEEIENGRVLVAACISAAGLEAFQPWPASKEMIVGADRDEGTTPDGRLRDHRGERAARKLCMCQKDTVRCGIALPGAPGEKVDWLDILRRDGVQGVREGVFAAVEFNATDDDVAAEQRREDQVRAIERISKLYPLPKMDTLTLTYAHTAAGRVKVHRLVYSGGERDLIPITTPFGVAARLRQADQANDYGLRCMVQDMNGHPRAVDFDRGLLAKMGAAEIRSKLFQAGLRTEAEGDMIAVQCLKAADPEHEIIVVGRPGWQQITGYADPVFVGPDGTVIGAPVGIDLELSVSVRLAPDVARAGTLDGWRAAAAIAISVRDCEHWTLGLFSGFAGPLVSLTGLPSCGVNFSGLSTLGKTTGQRLAVSAWSTADLRRKGLFESAKTTENSIEPLAYRATGTVLALDDFAHVTGKAVAAMIYTIAGDTGKKRMNPDASLRESYTWATFGIFSCECSLEEKVCGDDGEWRAGMAVRFQDIDVTGVNGNVDRVTLNAIDGIERNYGLAGPAFISAMVEHGLHRQGPALRERVFKAAAVIAGSSDGALVRAATPLALLLVAGEMAVRFGLLPADTPVKEVVQWGWDRFQRSSDAAALDPQTQTISNLRQWIAERWDVTIKPVGMHGGINNREAVAWYDEIAIYIPTSRIREAAGNVLKQSQIGAVLNRCGLLAAKPEKDRFYVRTVPHVGKVLAYALSRREFGRSGHDADADSFTIHEGRRHA